MLHYLESLDELHSINFDSSSILASEQGIIEYNRLKQIHNPESEIITISKECYGKVKNSVDIVKNHYFHSKVRSKSCIKKYSLDYLWFLKYKRSFMLCKCSNTMFVITIAITCYQKTINNINKCKLFMIVMSS